MNKSELVKEVAGKAGMTQADAGKAVDAVIDVVTEQLKTGEKIAIAGFGTFETKHREARDGRNPKTGETVKIAEKTSATFKPSQVLKDLGPKAKPKTKVKA